MKFKILKQSRKSRARLGVLSTAHGDIMTPAFVPVATRGVVKTLTSEDTVRTGSQILISNTFHLHIRPGESVVRGQGGLHRFMHWDRPLMTDSGGFQVFSLGFGREHGIGKVAKGKIAPIVAQGTQPAFLKITDEGVWFRSPLDGGKLFLSPYVSIAIQHAIGADIMFAFDECPPPNATKDYVQTSLIRTHRWAAESLAAHHESGRSRQALYGIVQGGRYKNLRQESARTIGAMPFDGFGIGGEFGASKKSMVDMLGVVFAGLPREKPCHLLGIGHPEDILPIIKAGVDTFDCIVPTHYARHGIAFTARGRLDMQKSVFFNDKKPLDSACACEVCSVYSRAYIAHLLRAKEITALRLLTFHNLFFFNTLVANIRNNIAKGVI